MRSLALLLFSSFSSPIREREKRAREKGGRELRTRSREDRKCLAIARFDCSKTRARAHRRRASVGPAPESEDTRR